MRITLSLILCFLWQLTNAQSITPQGSWHDYFSYYTGHKIVEANTRVYLVCENALLYFDAQDSAIHRLSKINGLHDVGIQTAAYSQSENALIVVYKNANIDIIFQTSGKIVNIPAIAQKQIYGDKTIFDLACDEQFAYLIAGFGMVTINIAKEEISDTYYMTFKNVNQVLMNDSTFYLATTTGLKYCKRLKESPVDSSSWHNDTILPKLNYRKIFFHQNKLFAEAALYQKYDTLYYIENNKKQVFMGFDKYMKEICPTKNGIAVNNEQEIHVYDSNRVVKRFINWQNAPHLDEWFYINKMLFDKYDRFWIMTSNGSFAGEGFTKYLNPQSPTVDNISHIAYKHNALYVAHGNFSWTRSGATVIKDDTCHRSEFGSGSRVIVPSNDSATHYYVAGYHDPLYERHSFTKPYTIYDYKNTPLDTANWGGVYFGGMALDKKDNLFVINWYNDNPVLVKSKTGKWYSLPFTESTAEMTGLYIDQKGSKWLAAGGSGYQIMVFNENGTFENQSDDKVRALSLIDASGESIGGVATCFAQDQNGVMWVGTNTGLVSYASPDRVFTDKSPVFSRSKVETNGYIEYLLNSEFITSIYIDPGNRKWVGTKSGVYLISANGEEQLLHFTTENSPLPNNYVTSVCMYEDKGEVFIGTANGMVSYSADTKQTASAMDDIIVSPNPVKPNFQGLIAIDGLTVNTEVKITDMAGNLVYETVSNGGRAVWDGRNMHGNRVTTGVYMVFCSNADASVTGTAKIFFIQ